MRCSLPSVEGKRCVFKSGSILAKFFIRTLPHKDSKIEKVHLLSENVRVMIASPPKYTLLRVVAEFIGRSAIDLVRLYGQCKRNFMGKHFWVQGDFVSAVGRDDDQKICWQPRKRGCVT